MTTTTETAYAVYYYSGSTGHGMAGRIKDTGSAITPNPNLQYTGLNGDPIVQWVLAVSCIIKPLLRGAAA